MSALVTKGLNVTENNSLLTKGLGLALAAPVIIVPTGGGTDALTVKRQVRKVSQREFKFEIDIIGQKFERTRSSYDIYGRKQFIVNNEIVIFGGLKSVLDLLLEVDGTKMCNVERLFEIKATVLKPTESVTLVTGTGFRTFEQLVDVYGSKFTMFQAIRVLQGMRTTDVTRDALIIGKRDIRNILVALDLID